MSKYDGASRYTNQLTIKENLFCEYFVNENLTQAEAFKKAYPELSQLPSDKIWNRLKRYTDKDKIKKRIEELKAVKDAKNQTENQKIILIENEPRKFFLANITEFLYKCKADDDRNNEFKALESIAKVFNLYGDNNAEAQKQINQIIINNNDVTLAIDAIQQLANNSNN